MPYEESSLIPSLLHHMVRPLQHHTHREDVMVLGAGWMDGENTQGAKAVCVCVGGARGGIFPRETSRVLSLSLS